MLLSPASVTNSASIAHQGIATHTSPRLGYESGRSLQQSPVRVSFLSSQQASSRVELGRSARLVLNIPKFSHISADIRNELHWLPIRRRIDFKIAFMVRHCLVGAAPEYLMEQCYPAGSAVGRQCLRSASRGDLVVPRFRVQTFGHRAFSGPQIWNSLPLGITQSRDNSLLCKQTESASVSAVLSAFVDPHLIYLSIY